MSEGAASLASEGDRLADLYVRHIGRAVGVARLLTNDDHAAEDIAQEAFLRVAGRFGHLRNADAFEGYLRRTVLNLCRSRWRRLRLERDWLHRQDHEEPSSDFTKQLQERDVLWRGIQALPWRQRAALVLRYYEDLSVDQSAEALRCSRRAAEALISRALASLRLALKEDEA